MILKNNKTIIIAEAGVNHNGNMQLARKLIDVASKAGADYVKFQSFDVDHLILRNTKSAIYQEKNLKKKGDKENNYLKQLKILKII